MDSLRGASYKSPRTKVPTDRTVWRRLSRIEGVCPIRNRDRTPTGAAESTHEVRRVKGGEGWGGCPVIVVMSSAAISLSFRLLI